MQVRLLEAHKVVLEARQLRLARSKGYDAINSGP